MFVRKKTNHNNQDKNAKNDTSFIKTLFLAGSRLAIIPLFQVIKKRIVIWVTR